MTAHNPRIARRNRCLKHQMYLYHQADATECYVLECEPEAVVSTTSNLTIPPPTQSVSALKTCCPMSQILQRLNFLRWLTLQCLPMNNVCHLNLPITINYRYFPNLKFPDAAQTQDASTAAAEAEVSLAGTSAPLLTNPSLTDVPVSVPPLPDGISNLQDTETNNTELSGSDEPAARYNVPSTRNRGRLRAALSRGSTRRTPSQYQDLRSRAQRQGRRGRPRGRPPRRPRGHTTTSLRQTHSREIDTQPSITSDSDSEVPTAQPTSDVDQKVSQVNPHYDLCCNRAPRYRCGTCGFRDCTCVLALNKSPTNPIGPPKTPVCPKPQPFIHNGKLLVSRVVIRAEKTYTGLERERIFPVEVVLEELSKSKVAEEPCPRFKEWTSDLRGLEFTLAVTLSPVTPNIVFGPFNFERGNPSKWSAVLRLISYLTKTASHVSLVKSIALPNIGGYW